MDFKEWFCLNGRDSFTIDAQINPDDAQFYFGRPTKLKELQAQLRKGFIDPGVPKIFIYGSYGSGKTQTLYHLDYYLQHDPPRSLRLKPTVVHAVLEMQSKSDHLDWHLQLMEALGKERVSRWLDGLFSKVPSMDAALASLFSDYNMTNAVKNLRGGGEMPMLAWRWLAGHRLSPTELQRLQLTRNAGDIGAADIVKVLVGLGHLAEKNDEKLIFFMDEVEQFRNITNPDCLEAVHNYLRQLSEPKNSSVGFIMSFYALTEDEMPQMVARGDIRNRIGAINYIEIPPLPSVEDVRAFISELLSNFIDRKAAEDKIEQQGLSVSLDTYPFDAEAFERLCDYASQDPVKALPRNIIKSINEAAISAWDVEKAVIHIDIVNEVASLVFG
jgi:hypothetical protein